jgi:hypothetical protein
LAAERGRRAGIAAIASRAGTGARAAAVLAAAAGLEAGGRVSPAEARREAHRILGERRFHGSKLPQPLHGVLQWLGRHLGFIKRWWDGLGRHVGGPDVLWWIVAGIVVALALFFAIRLARRRTHADRAAVERVKAERSLDPRELEKLADEAETRGDLELALRLRFRAGLIRLARADRLPERPSLRTYEARRILRSPRFDRLARDFDEIVYGRRAAQVGDVAAAREEWPRVVAEAR